MISVLMENALSSPPAGEAVGFAASDGVGTGERAAGVCPEAAAVGEVSGVTAGVTETEGVAVAGSVVTDVLPAGEAVAAGGVVTGCWLYEVVGSNTIKPKPSKYTSGHA